MTSTAYRVTGMLHTLAMYIKHANMLMLHFNVYMGSIQFSAYFVVAVYIEKLMENPIVINWIEFVWEHNIYRMCIQAIRYCLLFILL